MTKRDSVVTGKCMAKLSTTLAIFVMATTTLIAIMSMITLTNDSTYAQINEDHGSFSKMTSDLHGVQQEKMINGTINLEETIIEAIDSKVNISLTQAISTAEQSVGNNSFALAAFGADLGGDLVYIIILGSHGTEFYNVIVDPGNGQILSLQKSTQSEIEIMHLKHSKAMVEEADIGARSFGLRALRH
jgi:hypothetical protein